MIGTIIAFVSSLVLIGCIMLYHFLTRKKYDFTVCEGTKVYLENGVVVIPEAVETEIDDLIIDLRNAKLLSIKESTSHISKMSIHLYPPINGGPSISSPHVVDDGRLFNGLTYSPYTIHVTWYANKHTALKYEIINALIWNYLGSDLAHDEANPNRKLWNSLQ